MKEIVQICVNEQVPKHESC